MRLGQAVFGFVATVLVFTLGVGRADAQVTRIDLAVVESPALDGTSFGEVGRYERLRGVVYGEVDPDDPRHREIVNIDYAPRNSRGRVEYSTTVEIYRPLDMTRWNRALYHTVPNRGGAGAADRALLEMGFALVRVGWQGDLTPTDRNIVPVLPVARNPDGSPLVGPALEEFVFDNQERSSEARLIYPAATLDPAGATLTVRHDRSSPRAQPSDLSWRYLDGNTIRIERPAGFDGGALYEFVYEAKDPVVTGLGFVAMRDVISFLRYDARDGSGNPNPLASGGLPTTAISLGISQSGRYLKDMLYQGFNEDVAGRIVFDGMHPDISGSRKTSTNYAFSQPGRLMQQHENHLYPGDQFPFTYATLRDPISGRTDGLLERCSASNTCPKIIHTDSETEVWQARASLVVTDPRGRDIGLPDNVRMYVVAGTQHGGGAGVHAGPQRPTRTCQNTSNPLSYRPVRTALSVALYEWVTAGVAPPASRYPTAASGGLVPAAANGFPSIPGVSYSATYNVLQVHDHSVVPPTEGAEYTVLVGSVDEDGNMIGGIRPPTLSAPIGTHTGWNLRREGFAEGALCGSTGSYIPFAATQAERTASGDPRLSIEERYPDHQAYVAAVARAAQELVRERLLLEADARDMVRQAEGSSIGR